MYLPGRLAAAIEVLEDISRRHRPAAHALKDWGASHRFAGSGDRAAIGNLVYDALRRRASHAFAMQDDSPRALVLSVAVRDWGENPVALATAFSADRFAPAPISEVETERLLAHDALAAAPDHVRADVPQWLAPSLARSFGDAWIAEARGLTGRPPLDIRVNALKANPEKVRKALKRFNPEPVVHAPFGLTMPAGRRDARTPNVQTDQGYLKGWFEVQDQGSQLVATLAGVRPGNQVLDLCAGAGGKTLALAAAMNNTGQIFAHDADRSRLAPIYDRLKRNGVRNTQVRPPEPGGLADLADRMDLVLVDAPCTGTGTWRRRPDTKWRLTAEQLAIRCDEQTRILEDAARFVKPGGRLAYITCSVLPEENTDRVQAFLNENGNFTAMAPEIAWESATGAALPDRVRRSNLAITLTPATMNSDGFHIAVLMRR